MSGRQNDIDIAKGLGILLVAAGHTPLWASLGVKWLGPAIFSFHMPLFLFLSGLFLPVRKGFGSVVSSRAYGLLLPYLLGALTFIGLALFEAEPARLELLYRGAWATGQSLGWPWTPLWYLPHLFLSTLAAWGLAKLWIRLDLARWKWFCLCVLFLIGTRHLFQWENGSDFELFERELNLLGLPWSLDLLPSSLVWLLVAYAFGKDLRSLASQAWAFPVFAGLGTLLYWRTAWSLNLNVRTYDHLAGSTLMACLGIIAVLALSFQLSRLEWPSRLFSSLGRASLWILISHTYVQTWLYVQLWDQDKGPTPNRFLLWGFLAGWILPWALHALRESLPRWWIRYRTERAT